jgi:hypothetical protein
MRPVARTTPLQKPRALRAPPPPRRRFKARFEMAKNAITHNPCTAPGLTLPPTAAHFTFSTLLKNVPGETYPRTKHYRPAWPALLKSRSTHTQSWWSWSGSNRRPSACKADALPAELQPPLSVCAAQPPLAHGGSGWVRTNDPRLIKTVL